MGGTTLSACKDIDQQFWCEGKSDQKWKLGETKMQTLITALGMVQGMVQEDCSKILIFVNDRETVKEVVDAVRAEGYTVEGFMRDPRESSEEQRKRLDVLQRFQEHSSVLPFLVATQVLAAASQGAPHSGLHPPRRRDWPQRPSRVRPDLD